MHTTPEIFELKCEINHLRQLKDDAQGKLHRLQDMMRLAGFPMKVKIGEDEHGNEDFMHIRAECQLGEVLNALSERYSLAEIEAACGEEIAMVVRKDVAKRRAAIDAAK